MQFDQLKRREFITLLGGATVPWPLAGHAQQPALPVIGFIGTSSPGLFVSRVAAFHEGLKAAGYVEGQNVATEYRWAQDRYDQLPAMAADLVRRQVAVFVTASTPPTLAAKAATSTIPIVFIIGVDPVKLGLVASLNRPAGNVTGVTFLTTMIAAKLFELLREVVPTAPSIGLLVNPSNPNAESEIGDSQVAAERYGQKLVVVKAQAESDFVTVFGSLVEQRAGALVISTDLLFSSRYNLLASLALRHGLPTLSGQHEFTTAGGLMSYGTKITDGFVLVGIYASRILKGEKAADLPVQQSTKVELVINLTTAKALGISFPVSVLGRADAVIE